MEAEVRGGVLVDTSAWYATVDDQDPHHAAARRRFLRLHRERRLLVVTGYIVAETYTLLRTRLGSRMGLAFLRGLHVDPLIRRISVPDDWEEDVERLLAQFHDQVFSYVDATSFVTMRRLALHEAFSFDRDFLIAGFALVGDP